MVRSGFQNQGGNQDYPKGSVLRLLSFPVLGYYMCCNIFLSCLLPFLRLFRVVAVAFVSIRPQPQALFAVSPPACVLIRLCLSKEHPTGSHRIGQLQLLLCAPGGTELALLSLCRGAYSFGRPFADVQGRYRWRLFCRYFSSAGPFVLFFHLALRKGR